MLLTVDMTHNTPKPFAGSVWGLQGFGAQPPGGEEDVVALANAVVHERTVVIVAHDAVITIGTFAKERCMIEG